MSDQLLAQLFDAAQRAITTPNGRNIQVFIASLDKACSAVAFYDRPQEQAQPTVQQANIEQTTLMLKIAIEQFINKGTGVSSEIWNDENVGFIGTLVEIIRSPIFDAVQQSEMTKRFEVTYGNYFRENSVKAYQVLSRCHDVNANRIMARVILLNAATLVETNLPTAIRLLAQSYDKLADEDRTNSLILLKKCVSQYKKRSAPPDAKVSRAIRNLASREIGSPSEREVALSIWESHSRHMLTHYRRVKRTLTKELAREAIKANIIELMQHVESRNVSALPLVGRVLGASFLDIAAHDGEDALLFAERIQLILNTSAEASEIRKHLWGQVTVLELAAKYPDALKAYSGYRNVRPSIVIAERLYGSPEKQAATQIAICDVQESAANDYMRAAKDMVQIARLVKNDLAAQKSALTDALKFSDLAELTDVRFNDARSFLTSVMDEVAGNRRLRIHRIAAMQCISLCERHAQTDPAEAGRELDALLARRLRSDVARRAGTLRVSIGTAIRPGSAALAALQRLAGEDAIKKFALTAA